MVAGAARKLLPSKRSDLISGTQAPRALVDQGKLLLKVKLAGLGEDDFQDAPSGFFDLGRLQIS